MLDPAIQDEISRAISANTAQAAGVFIDHTQAYFDELRRPSTMYRPTLTQDGDMFIALLGPNLQEGVVGVGETPQKAMQAFDLAWKSPARRAKES